MLTVEEVKKKRAEHRYNVYLKYEKMVDDSIEAYASAGCSVFDVMRGDIESLSEYLGTKGFVLETTAVGVHGSVCFVGL